MTQETSDEMLMALADGELPDPEAAALHARIAADPALADRYAVFAGTRAALRAAFPPEPVPASLIAGIMAAPVSQSEDAAPPSRAEGKVVAFPQRLRRLAPMALAASLVLAVGLGGYLGGAAFGPRAPVSLAAAAVASLSDAVTGQDVGLRGGAQARVLGSYMTDAGLCRLVGVETLDGTQERVLACRPDDPVQRAGGEWQVLLEVAMSIGHGTFLPASAGAETLVDDLLDRLGAGPALTEAEERAALGP
jgi:hypothetical protein